MHTPEDGLLPTTPQLLRATAAALVAAAIILTTIVLPAEYGLDPTGIGTRLGFFRPRAVPIVVADDPAAAAGSPSSVSGGLLSRKEPFRTDEMSIVLEAGEGKEIKAQMTRGERFVFTWTSTGGPVDVDMHGEPAGAADGEAISYLRGEGQTMGHGAFEAPVAGTHGWFWQNLGAEPVTITVKTSGFYARLLQP